jgi:SAM-dependent methyltransferase
MAIAGLVDSALELRLFTEIASGADTFDVLRARLAVSERGLRIMLDALESLGMLARSDGRLSVPPGYAPFLVEGSDLYLGDIWLVHQRNWWPIWSRVSEAVRDGRSISVAKADEIESDLWPRFVKPLSFRSYWLVPRLMDHLKLNGPRVLDVGCGSGIIAHLILKADPAARAVGVDWPAVIKVAEAQAVDFGVADRFEATPGSFHEVHLGTGYDLIVLSNVCHSEGPESNRRLLRRCFDACAPGGRVAIIESFPDDPASAKGAPLLALMMLVYSNQGDAFPVATYHEWLEEAGFGAFEALPVGLGYSALLATRPA